MTRTLFISLLAALTLSLSTINAQTSEPVADTISAGRQASSEVLPELVSMAPDEYEDTVRALFREQRWELGKYYLEASEREWGVVSMLYMLHGRYYMHAGDTKTARRYLLTAVNDDESNTEALELLVKLEEEQKNYSTAIVHVNELLRFSPYNPRLWRKKIELYRLLGNDSEANRLLYRLQQIYPEDEQIRQDVIYLKQQEINEQRKSGKESNVQKALVELIDTNPRDADYYLELSSSLLKEGKRQQAEEVCAKGVLLTHGNTRLIRRRVAILTEESRYQEAEFYLKDCIRLYGLRSMDNDLTNLQAEAAEAADNNEAYTRYQHLYGKTGSQEALDWLIRKAMQRGYWDDAEQYIREDMQRNGQNKQRLAQAYLVQQRLGNQKAADRIAEQLFLTDPHDADIRQTIAQQRLITATDLMRDENYKDALLPLYQADTLTTDSLTRLVISHRISTCLSMIPDTTRTDSLIDDDYLSRALRFEKAHNYDSAYVNILRYVPAPNEYVYVRRHGYTLHARTMHNSLSFDYQYARRSSVDEWSHNASVNYTHSWTHDAMEVAVAYAGRESASWTETTDEGNDTTITTKGGSGVQLGAGYMHYFDWGDIDLHATWASLFFPVASAKIAVTENLPKEWTLTERAAWRYIRETDESLYHLFSVGLMATKQLNGFLLSPAIDIFIVNNRVYANGNAKMQYFPLEGDRSNVFTSFGIGNAPEISILDNNLPLRFADLNTNVSVGGNYVINGHLSISASASWYVISNNANSTRNYLYLNAGLNINF